MKRSHCELLSQCLHVASPEGCESFPYQVFVRMCHLISPLVLMDRSWRVLEGVRIHPRPLPCWRLPGSRYGIHPGSAARTDVVHVRCAIGRFVAFDSALPLPYVK